MKRPGFLLRFALLLVFVGIAGLTSYTAAREVSVFGTKYTRRASNDGNKFENGNDVVIQVDTNCAWLYLNDGADPAFWSNNISIFGTGYGYKKDNGDEVRELGGALRFGQGATSNTNPMILTGDVTFLGDATIGVQTKTPQATGIITGQLKLDADAPADTEFLYRGRNAATASGSDVTGILILTGDSASFTAPIRVGSGTLQLGYITDTVTATGWDWVDNGAGGETYKQNTAKQFVFDGSTGSVASSSIDVTSVFGGNDVSTLKFQRSGSVTVNNAITGTGKVVLTAPRPIRSALPAPSPRPLLR